MSADFRRHPVGRFIEPLIDAHDKRRFSIFCYSNVASSDDVTERMSAKNSKNWRDILKLDDQSLASAIANDGIDILVDLSGHTAGNRLSVFLRKPAPIQVSYMGYFASTGLAEIEYWLVDRVLFPPDVDSPGPEKLWRLDRCYLAYAKPEIRIDLAAPILSGSRPYAFGSFNHISKLSDETIALWSQVLNVVEHSTLTIKGHDLKYPITCREILGNFSKYGISEERLKFLGGAFAELEHFKFYNSVDSVLETLSPTGCTTTCDALWMGVPIVSLVGTAMSSRMSYSVLAGANLGHTAALNKGEYVSRAKALAEAGPLSLAQRKQQRKNVESSPMMDIKGMPKSLERAFRMMLQRSGHI